MPVPCGEHVAIVVVCRLICCGGDDVCILVELIGKISDALAVIRVTASVANVVINVFWTGVTHSAQIRLLLNHFIHLLPVW